VKLKILFSGEVDVVDGSPFECTTDCRFIDDGDGPPFCNAFGEKLQETLHGCVRCQKCVAAAGNHNILGKCLAGE
jgi:hypothetical protein